MSTSTPGAGQGAATNPITLPPGVQIQAGRETTQTNGQGQVVQGMVFPITLPGGSVTTVFVPYNILGNPAQVQQLFNQRINAILAITGS